MHATSGEEDPGESKATRESRRRKVQWKMEAKELLADVVAVAADSAEASEVAEDSGADSEEASEAEEVADSGVVVVAADVAEEHHAEVVAVSPTSQTLPAKAQHKVKNRKRNHLYIQTSNQLKEIVRKLSSFQTNPFLNNQMNLGKSSKKKT